MQSPDPSQPLRAAALPALVMATVLLATASRYDLHGDELYFRMLPLRWWYEDQPPVTVWLSRLAAALSDQVWVQRVPAVVAASGGVFLAAAGPWLLGYGDRVQRVAAWAHAGTVYPLLVGHVFLTSSVDLVVWQAIILLTLAALLGHRWALAWAGVVAGVGCWNKLLVLVLVASLGAALLAAYPRRLWRRDAAVGALALAVIGGPQLLAQLLHGSPMSRVSGDLIALNGPTNRWLVLPLLVAFLGPPFIDVWRRGIAWRPAGAPHRPLPFLAVAGVLVVAWTLAFPAQPYYPIAAFLPALAIGWGMARDAHATVWRRRWPIVAANSLVALLLCLPLVPTSTPVYVWLSAANPVQRDQAGWRGYVEQVAVARGDADTSVVTDSYALAGALAYHGPALGIRAEQVASGHNAVWNMGPPPGDFVLLVGPRAVERRDLFASCTDAGRLRPTESDPFRTAGSPMIRCEGPIGGWQQVWPHFRHLGA